MWQDALNFALDKHSHQTDVHGLPYGLHVLRVMAGVSRMGVNQPEVLAAAILHDVVEDCEVEPEEVGRYFGSEVQRLVGLLTHPKSEDYRAYIERVDTDRLARIIKLADLEDNTLTWRSVPNNRKIGLYAAAIVRLQSGEWP